MILDSERHRELILGLLGTCSLSGERNKLKETIKELDDLEEVVKLANVEGE